MRRIAAFLAAALSVAGASAGEAGDASKPSYMSLVPMISIRVDSLAEAARTIEAGLVGSGVDATRATCERYMVSICFLDSTEGIDPYRPIHYFMVCQDPPVALPEPAVVLPLRDGGSKEILAGLRAKYRDVEGGSIKICASPHDESAIEPLYVAIAQGNALISPSIDAIRYLAYNLMNKTLPEAERFRDSPIALSASGPLLGLFMELVSSLDTGLVSDNATAGNTLLHIRELGVFFSSFERIDLALSASMSRWEVTTRLKALPGSATARRIDSFSPPSASLTASSPRTAPKRYASNLAGFVSALPESNRKWLASLADNTRMVGLGIFPGAFDLDEILRPHIGSAAASCFVIDNGASRIGAVTIAELSNPSAAAAALDSYFSSNGLSRANSKIRRIVQNDRNGVKVSAYNVIQSLSSSGGSGMGQAGTAISFMLGLDHIETAVANGRLVVARGRTGLIAPWISSTRQDGNAETLTSLTSSFDKVPDGEILLGGGSAEPVAIANRLIVAIPEMRDVTALLPHPGSGVVWRMTRTPGGVLTFDGRIYNNEIIAFNRMRSINSSTMREFLSQLVLRHFQQTTDEAARRDNLRKKVRSLRDRDIVR